MRGATVGGGIMLTATLIVSADPVFAQGGIFAGLQKGLESTFSAVSTTTTFASGEVTRTETRNLFPALTLNLNSLIYPNLRLNAGGVFEVNMFSTDIDGSATDSTISRNRPFILIRSTNPAFSPGFGYSRREERARTAGLPAVKLVNDEYAGYLGWQPAGGPRSEAQVIRTRTYDGNRTIQDQAKTFGSLLSNYAHGNFGAFYRASYLETDDRIDGLQTRQISQGGRATYTGAFLAKRLLWNAMYNIDHQRLQALARGTEGEVDVPVIPFAGLAALSDTPVTAQLSPNAVLIDGNLTAGSGIDLGLTAPPADLQARNIGLDFLNPAEVNRILVWVDRELPLEVASSFAWEIFSSPDNLIWRREATVSAAPFGPFEHRFQLDFPVVTARYLKVVTRPLSPVVLESSRFPDIFVTEIQAFSSRPPGEETRRLSRTTHLINTDVRLRILTAPRLLYEGYFLYNGPSAFGTSTANLSNGLSVHHAFGRIFSAFARGAREQGTEAGGDRVATLMNATLTADPLPTIRSFVLFSGEDERVAGIPLSRKSLFVRNAAQPYRGIDVLFGFGWAFTTRETGEKVRERLVSLSGTVLPREHVSLTFSYDSRVTERSRTAPTGADVRERRLYGALSVDPLRTLHLVVGGDVIAITGQRTRSTLDLGMNWAPFPDGALQLLFVHNEARRAVEFGRDRSTIGVVRLKLSRRSYADLSYQKTRSEFVFQTTQSRVLSLTLRLFV